MIQVKNLTKKFGKLEVVIAKIFLKVFPPWITPNHITIFRFLTIPFIILLLFSEKYLFGIILFSISAFSDMIDGALARVTNQITEWGKMSDPLADKMLIGSAAAIIVSKFINVYLAAAIIFIELLLILNGYYKKKYQNIVVQAVRAGKIKMNLQSFGIGLLLLHAIYPFPLLLVISTYFLYFSLVFALVSLVVYRSI